MIEQLNNNFVNAWVVIPQLETINTAFQTEEARVIARAAKAAYTYPVDSLVLTPEGKVVSQLAVDELFKLINSQDWDTRYLRFLGEGMSALNSGE